MTVDFETDTKLFKTTTESAIIGLEIKTMVVVMAVAVNVLL